MSRSTYEVALATYEAAMAEHRAANRVLDEHFRNHTAPCADEIAREQRARDAVAEARTSFLQNFREELDSLRSKGIV